MRYYNSLILFITLKLSTDIFSIGFSRISDSSLTDVNIDLGSSVYHFHKRNFIKFFVLKKLKIPQLAAKNYGCNIGYRFDSRGLFLKYSDLLTSFFISGYFFCDRIKKTVIGALKPIVIPFSDIKKVKLEIDRWYSTLTKENLFQSIPQHIDSGKVKIKFCYRGKNAF